MIEDINPDYELHSVCNCLDELKLIRKIAGTVAHEVRNSLSIVRGQLQLLEGNNQLKKYHEKVETMITEIDRAAEILTELLHMSKPSRAKLEKQNVNQILHQLYQLLQAEALINLQEVIYELEDIPDVMLDKKRFRQVVLNLVNNGLQAMNEHKKITIRTFARDGKVYFVVKDQGGGIPPEVLNKLGTPFVTTKAGGTGLGLAASYQIIAEHKAGIQVDSGSDGTTFTIIFDEAVS
ncbi:MAG: hypothetical protein GX434_00490 [Peptococcaceae bacterium]|nr:hypothetical protein [Peptococcaceae bacterium]